MALLLYCRDDVERADSRSVSSSCQVCGTSWTFLSSGCSSRCRCQTTRFRRRLTIKLAAKASVATGPHQPPSSAGLLRPSFASKAASAGLVLQRGYAERPESFCRPTRFVFACSSRQARLPDHFDLARRIRRQRADASRLRRRPPRASRRLVALVEVGRVERRIVRPRRGTRWSSRGRSSPAHDVVIHLLRDRPAARIDRRRALRERREIALLDCHRRRRVVGTPFMRFGYPERAIR